MLNPYVAAGMKPVINLDEQIGKTVGKRERTVADYDQLVAQSDAIVRRLPFPKGVYRFRTHEEADAWIEKHMMAAALKKARAPQNDPT